MKSYISRIDLVGSHRSFAHNGDCATATSKDCKRGGEKERWGGAHYPSCPHVSFTYAFTVAGLELSLRVFIINYRNEIPDGNLDTVLLRSQAYRRRFQPVVAYGGPLEMANHLFFC